MSSFRPIGGATLYYVSATIDGQDGYHGNLVGGFDDNRDYHATATATTTIVNNVVYDIQPDRWTYTFNGSCWDVPSTGSYSCDAHTVSTRFDVNKNVFNINNFEREYPSTAYSGSITIYLYWRAVAQTPSYTVTVLPDPSDGHGGTVSGGGSYNSGASCTINATPNANAGYYFVNWTSNLGGTASTQSYTFPVNSDVTWTAHFRTYRLLYGTSGRLLCDSGGRLLYNG